VPAPFLAPLVRELPAGVRRARLPTPFAASAVNCYLLIDPPVTIVDPGVVTAASLEALGAVVDGGGCSFDDIEQVVVTHAHPDHFGAAAWVARRSGAPILAGRAEVPALLGRWHDDRRPAMLTALGVPTDLVAATGQAGRWSDLVEFAEDVDVVALDDGDVVHAGGRALSAHVTPGHATGHLSLWCDDGRFLLSGDHLLARIVPLPALDPAVTGTGHRPSLGEYMSSLARFVALDPAVVLPGHGEAFTDVAVLARRLCDHHAERCATVKAVVSELGRPTPFEVTERLLWQADGGRLLRGVAEVVGHLDLLEETGEVVTEADGAMVRYRVT
jgi:glyoxylase-like metal-dependent hydrolase (beta-lactamase superfamily II)